MCNSEEATAGAGNSIGPSHEIAIFPKGTREHVSLPYTSQFWRRKKGKL